MAKMRVLKLRVNGRIYRRAKAFVYDPDHVSRHTGWNTMLDQNRALILALFQDGKEVTGADIVARNPNRRKGS
jgi:hypothetical protein